MKVVELGGGDNPRYHPNVDIRKLPNVDIVADFEKPLPLPDNEYDIVYSSYVIEHVSWRRVKGFIKEIYRILKPSGKAAIITANLLEQCKVAVNTSEWNEDISCLIFGGQDYEGNYHKCGFSPEYVIKLFKEAGFSKVEVKPHPNCATDMVIEAFKEDYPKRQLWLIRKTEELLQEEKLPQVVDIGSADGWIFKSSKIQRVSVDLDVYKLPFFVRADAEHLPFKDKAFGVAVLGELLEHVKDPVMALKEANRVGHNILATVPFEYEWDKRHKPCCTLEERLRETGLTAEQQFRRDNPAIIRLCMADDVKHGFHNRWYTDEMLKDHLLQAGIKNAKIEPLRYEGWSFRVVQAPVKEEVVTPRKNKLKIGLISSPFLRTPPRTYGGMELIVANLAECLAKSGHAVTIFATNGSKVKGCKVVEFGAPKLKVQVDWLQAEKEAYEVYKDQLTEFDIIHGHDWFGFEYLAKTKNPKLKVCHTHHGHLNMKWWGRSKPPFKINFIAISKWMQKVYKSQGFESRVCYNGINLDDYPFSDVHGDRLLFVGRIDKFKQPHVAIEVAKKLDMGLDIVGGTFVQEPSYLERIRNMCDGEQIEFYPDASHEKKVELMRNARCLVFPSRMGEPFGLVPVEAMACGTPVIALNDGAVEEVVREGGAVCDVYDTTFTEKGPVVNIKGDPVEAMVEAVKRIDKIKPEDARKNAEQFSREVMAKNYLCRFNEILDGDEW